MNLVTISRKLTKSGGRLYGSYTIYTYMYVYRFDRAVSDLFIACSAEKV